MTFGKRYRPNVPCFKFLLLIFVRSPYIPRATPPHPNPIFVRFVFPSAMFAEFNGQHAFVLYRYLTSLVPLPVILFQPIFVFDRE
jgi:hypothetical protein